MKNITIFSILILVLCVGAQAQRTIPGGTLMPILNRHQVTHDIPYIPVQSDNQLYALSSSQKASTVFYYDGLGRNNHIIQNKMSPLGDNLIQIIKFDDKGRLSKLYLPYASDVLVNPEQEQAAFYASATDRVADDAYPFTQTKYDQSPLGRVVERGGAGQAWQPGSTHTHRYVYRINTAGDAVRQFKSDGSSTGIFAAGELTVVEQTDPDGNNVIQFIDKAGRVLLQKQQYGGTINGSTVAYLDTYFVYDDFGRVKYSIPPKAVNALVASSWTLNATIKNELVFESVYDTRNRTVERKVPGSGWVYFVYDKLDRLVLTQQANQRAGNEWEFIKYDVNNRVIMTGFYTDAVNNTRALMQTYLDNRNYSASDKYYEVKQAGTTFGYSNQSFPQSNITETYAAYYDSYDFDHNGSADFAYANQSLGADEPAPVGFVRGNLTGQKKRILGTNTWLTEVMFYDVYDRLVQKRSNNQLNATVEDVVTVVYNFQGLVLKKKEYQKVSASNSVTVLSRFTYDAGGRVVKAFQTINSLPEKLIAKYEYNELGQPVEKKLAGMGATGEEGFLQTVDYSYNIRGWLTKINNSELAYNEVSNNDNDDVFGMELRYESTAGSLGNTALYAGNVSGVKWQQRDGLNSNQPMRERAYVFEYYKNDQLKNAKYKAFNGSAWSAETGAYDFKNVTYDHNGNLLGYERYSKASDAGAVTKIDHLTYTYQGNRVLKVEDSGTTQGFNNGVNQATEYTYDQNGNLASDLNKGITLTYNQHNKTTGISKSGTGSLGYEFDASGMKVSSTVTQGANSVKQYFINGFVYAGTTLLYFGMPEGRTNRTSGGAFENEYMITDHQGNVRVSFKQKVQTTTYVATIEDSGQPNASNPRVQEMKHFQALFDVEKAQVGQWLNKTASSSAVPSPNRAAYLTGSGARKIGPGISLVVKPGDDIHMEAFGKFQKPSSGSFNNVIVAGMAAAFAGNFTGMLGLESSTQVQGIYQEAVGLMGSYGGSDTDRPRAYINYLLFDKDFNFVDAGWDRIDAGSGFLQNQENTVSWDKVQLDITVAQAGYIYIYLSNESEGTQVWFDDMSVTHEANVPEITAANDYYPFGLRMEGVVNNTPVNNKTNQYGYNGGNQWINELNNAANFVSTLFREYDPVLGRFNGVDLMATKYTHLSPYNFAFNNPIRWNDPLGLEPPTAAEIADIILKLLEGGEESTWTRADWDNNVSRGSGTGGGCRGCSFYSYNPEGQRGYWVTDPTTTNYVTEFGELVVQSPRDIFVPLEKTQDCPSCLVADFLRNTPFFGLNNPNPFYGAEAIYVDGGWSFVGAEGDAGKFFILVGKDKGKFVSFKEIAGGVSTELGLGIELGRIDISGNPYDFNSSYLLGLREKVWLSAGEGISAGGAFSWSSYNGLKVYGSSIQLGIGLSPWFISGGYNQGVIKKK